MPWQTAVYIRSGGALLTALDAWEPFPTAARPRLPVQAAASLHGVPHGDSETPVRQQERHNHADLAGSHNRR